jgi:GTPase SAR1 family protein
MISLKSGLRVAEINIGKKKKEKQVIYIKDSDIDQSEINHIDKAKLLPKSFFKGLPPANEQLLKTAINTNRKGMVADNLNLQAKYDMAQEELKKLTKKYLEIPPELGKIEPIPMQESSRIGVFGPAGVGKSTWISNFIKKYLEYYKDNKVYVFSPKLDDPAFKKIKNLHYVKLDDSLVKDPLDVSEFKDSICLFDDIESITDKKLNNAVRVFRDQCYEIGRAPTNITTIAVHHVILANDRTKIILNESDQVVVFPKSNFAAISNLAKRYYGFTKDQLEYLRDVPSRWAVIKRSYPTTIISENAVKVL